MFKKLFFLLIIFSMAACSSRGLEIKSQSIVFQNHMHKKILLFIPGYYGSTLKEKDTGKLRWAKASQFFFSQKGVSIQIPGTTIGSTDELVVGDVLENVLVIPKLWDVDSYKSTLKQLDQFASDHQMRLETAPYDWREDFNISLSAIDKKIKSFNLGPNDELYVVGHSTGALLLAYYLRYGAQDVDHAVENWAGLKLIKKAALIAPPLHGLMILFRDMEDGTSLGLNRTLLNGLDYSTFRSTFFFLPPRGEDIGLNENKEKISLNIHDVDNWKKNSWGPFKYARASEVESIQKFVQKYMSRSEKFHALLRAPITTAPPKKLPLLHMRGLGTKTKEYALTKMKNERMTYSFGKDSEVDGDGTVTALSGVPLEYFRALDFTTIDSGLGHLEILSDPASQIFIQDFLKK
jgi:pimeloyl-ACP methyl ester carboxylesterase